MNNSRIDAIMNRGLSEHEKNKMAAMAVNQSGEPMVEPIKESTPIAKPPVHSSAPVDDTHYIASIVQAFYAHFEKYGATVAGTMTLAACTLKGNAALALTIKDLKSEIPVKTDKPIYAGKKRGRPKKK